MMVTRSPLCAASYRRGEIVQFAFIRVSLTRILQLRIVLNKECSVRFFSEMSLHCVFGFIHYLHVEDVYNRATPRSQMKKG